MKFYATSLSLAVLLSSGCSTPNAQAPLQEVPLHAQSEFTPEEREQRLVDARWNMIRLSGAFNTYNLNHDGPPPGDSWQQSLIDEGLRTPEELVSPATDNDVVEYVLVPASEISFDRGQILVYEDPDHHSEVVVVLFHDLHAESIPRERFNRLATEQGFKVYQ